MSEVVTIAADAVNAVLSQPSTKVKLIVQKALSYQVDGAETMAVFKQHKWDGRSSFFVYKNCSFPAGFLHFVAANLRREGYKVNIVRKPFPAPLGPERPQVDAFGYDSKYDYQPEVMDRLVKHGQIIAQIATGGGKSRIARLCFARIARPTLFLTTRSILMYKMKDAFEKDMGIPCSVFGDGQFGNVNAQGQTTIKMMSVGTVQTFMSKLEVTTIQEEFNVLFNAVQEKFKKEIVALKGKLAKAKKSTAEITAATNDLISKQQAWLKANNQDMANKAKAKFDEKNIERQKTIKLLSMFEFVILEEAHEASGNSYYEILRYCKNAHYRLALTGTPFMRESEESNMRLMACSGPIAIKVTEEMLIQRGVLAKPYFKYIELRKKPDHLLRTTGWQSAYRLGVTENEERNLAIVSEIIRAKAYGLTSMILVQHTSHGEHLNELLTQYGLRAEFIKGENNQAERKLALNKLASGSVDALIGTTILDVGVDVPAVGMIILAGGGKAEIALRQRIGRGLRAKKIGPNVAFIVDFTDHWNTHTKKHATQRREIVLHTKGFGENIVNDFNFEQLGFTRLSA
ncbi:DEAD/DEAH box helicase family protein [Acinetobacter baumannii 25442_5]|nr:helicase-related protein [Acinetobacter baumannii]EZI65395.1 DEAD/DEAH box helicase family protein [Acinetobacter baumannii 25442_5]